MTAQSCRRQSCGASIGNSLVPFLQHQLEAYRGTRWAGQTALSGPQSREARLSHLTEERRSRNRPPQLLRLSTRVQCYDFCGGLILSAGVHCSSECILRRSGPSRNGDSGRIWLTHLSRLGPDLFPNYINSTRPQPWEAQDIVQLVTSKRIVEARLCATTMP